jgi:hypothetical protein
MMALPNEVPVPDEHQARLLHDVERHLKPKSKSQPRKRARSFRIIRRIAITVGLLWLVGLGGALSGTLMASEGFRVDVLQQQLQQATRQQQHLAGLVAAATSPSALAQDASRLHVQLAPTVVPRPAPPAPAARPTLASRVRSTLSGLWKTLKTLEAGGHR